MGMFEPTPFATPTRRVLPEPGSAGVNAGTAHNAGLCVLDLAHDVLLPRMVPDSTGNLFAKQDESQVPPHDAALVPPPVSATRGERWRRDKRREAKAVTGYNPPR